MTLSKRLMDIGLALLLVIVLAGPILVIALWVLIVDGRPVFYPSERMKTPDTPFTLWKFRTMRTDRNDTGVSGGYKSARITRTGRVLRGKRLDELPQLFNILRGDMSFVGPRPPLRRYVELRPELYARVLENRPGVTGLATLSYLGAIRGGSPQLFIVVGMTFLILSVATRLLMRRVLLRIYANGTHRKPLIIFGAGQTGQQLAMALATDDAVEPVAFIDDDHRLQGLTVAGLRVYPPSELMKVVKRRGVKRIVLAIPSANRNKRAEITRRLSRTGCEVHALPSFADLVANNARNLSDTRPVNVNELLGRDQMEEELPGVSDTYLRRRIMVTGAGGSIGSEICRQLITCRPTSLILVDHSELALFEIDRELRSYCKNVEIVPVLGSVCDKSLVEAAIAENEVDIVLHAAAYKHVPLVEANGLEGIRVNVFGTKTVAEAARAAGVERFILVSTDKAVRPASIMGASKRFAELLVQDLATRSKTTRFSMVRFGNVLGSSGSVIPIFQKQISRGGPVTLTHAEITRYFMTIPESVRLVLLAGSFARGGDVFVLDMGKPVPVRQLARKMIESAGYTVRDASNPTGDIEIKITGLRPGEKLHEELLIGSDMLTTPHPKILRAQETGLSELEMANALQSLRQALETRGLDLMKQTLEKWIEKDKAKTVKTVNE